MRSPTWCSSSRSFSRRAPRSRRIRRPPTPRLPRPRREHRGRHAERRPTPAPAKAARSGPSRLRLRRPARPRPRRGSPARSSRPGSRRSRTTARVPLKWLPPGAFEQDRGPSAAVYPPQKLTLRFNHKFHVEQQKLQCKTCHAGATDERVGRRSPDAEGHHVRRVSRHRRTTTSNRVTPGDDASGKCNFCHVGYKEGDGNHVAKFDIPRPNMVFNHKKHAARNINCQQCHGDVQELELATRDQMPADARLLRLPPASRRRRRAARRRRPARPATCKGGAKEGGRIKTVVRERRRCSRRAGSTTRSTRPTSCSATSTSPRTTRSSARTATRRSSARRATTGACARGTSTRTTTSTCTRSRRASRRRSARAATASRASASAATSASASR